MYVCWVIPTCQSSADEYKKNDQMSEDLLKNRMLFMTLYGILNYITCI